MKVVTNRGNVIDVSKYLLDNGDAVALGNGKMNARGDRIDIKGNVVQPLEDIKAEYAKTGKSVKKVSLRDITSELSEQELPKLNDLQLDLKNLPVPKKK